MTETSGSIPHYSIFGSSMVQMKYKFVGAQVVNSVLKKQRETRHGLAKEKTMLNLALEITIKARGSGLEGTKTRLQQYAFPFHSSHHSLPSTWYV